MGVALLCEGRAGLFKALGLALLILLALSACPALAGDYAFSYSNLTSTVQAPSVSLVQGNAAYSSVSSVAPDAATAITTAGLTYYSNAALTTTTFAYGSASGASTTATTTTGNLGTAAGRLIYVTITIINSGSQTVTSVSDSVGSTYTFRQAVNVGTTIRVETWYAIDSSGTTPITVTAQLSGATRNTVVADSIGGVNTASPFDPSVTAAVTSTGSGTTASASITTSFPHDLLIGALGMTPTGTTTAGGGFTQRGSVTSGTGAGSLRSSAETESVTSTQSATSVTYGLSVTATWAFIVDALVAGSAPLTVDTSLTAPAAKSSTGIAADHSGFLWSSAYPTGATLYAGAWTLDLWAVAGVAGTLTVSIWVVDSTGAITAELLPPSLTTTIGTTKGEFLTTFAGRAATIPSGGYIMVVLTSPAGGTTFTIYRGAGQLSNFQTPAAFDYMLAMTSPAGGAWTANLAIASSANIGRLNNMTVTFKVPDIPTYSVYSLQVSVLAGVISQATGPTVTLAASTTMYVYIYATASSLGSSTFSLVLTLTPPTGTAYAGYTISLQVN